MTKNLKRIIIILTPAVMLLSSCSDNSLLDASSPISEAGWNIKDTLDFKVNVVDPSVATNFYINVRNADGYPYSNLYLVMITKAPNGKQASDTLECQLADDNGKWLGKGAGDIYDNRIPFKRNVRFPLAGEYSFRITHCMRTDVVPLIMDVGLRIEKAE